MNPTFEQAAQWAREAGFVAHRDEYEFKEMLRLFAIRAYTEGRAEQAEADAKLCEQVRIETFMTESYIRQVAQARETIAAAIRANAPKVTKGGV